MGIAIINQNADYSLERIAQNVIPTDAKYRKLLTSAGTFSYGNVSALGICKLNMVDLKGSTLPYLYKICNSSGIVISNRTGVSINEISGIITLSTGYDGQDVYVKLEPQIVTGYYNTAISGLITKAINAGSWSGDTPIYSNLSISTFTYTPVDSSGGSISPTISYSYTKTISGGSTTGSTEGIITYSFASDSHDGASINSTNGNVTFTANPPSERLYEVNARIVLPDGTNDTFTTNVKQMAALQLVTLESISAEAKSPTKIAGSLLTTSDFTVSKVFSDASTQALTSGFLMSPSSINSYGNNTITITYEGHSDTVTIQGIDAISAITYNEALNSQEPKYVPDITATLNHSYLGYKLYSVNNTTNNNVTAYDFSISNPTTVIGSSNTTIQDFATISTNSTDVGNVSFNTNSLLNTIPSGGILTDTSVQIKVTNHNDDKDFLNCTIDNPLAYIVESYNGQTIASSGNGTCYGRSAGSSGLTPYVPSTQFTTGSTLDAWRYYSYDVTGKDYLIIVSTKAISETHSLIVLNSDTSFLNSNGKQVTVNNAIFTFLPGTTIYKLKDNSMVYLMHYKDDQNISSNPFTVYGFSLS